MYFAIQLLNPGFCNCAKKRLLEIHLSMIFCISWYIISQIARKDAKYFKNRPYHANKVLV